MKEDVGARGVDEGERVEVFFYGLFMDEALLRSKGLRPEGRRLASVEGFRLVVGERATLAPAEGSEAHGVLFTLARGEVEALYSEESVRAYRAQAVRARVEGGGEVGALCFNLPTPPSEGERNEAYASKLRDLAARIGLPVEYVESIR